MGAGLAKWPPTSVVFLFLFDDSKTPVQDMEKAKCQDSISSKGDHMAQVKLGHKSENHWDEMPRKAY